MSPGQFLVDGTWPPEMIRHEGRYDEVAIEAAQLALLGGVTTVFDAWGPRDPLIKARDTINEGHAVGARIYLCGNWIGLGGPYSADMRPQFKEAIGDALVGRINALFEAEVGEALTRMPLEEARAEVRNYVRSGIDYVMYPVNVHRIGAFQHIVFSPRVQRMIVEEAHSAGLPAQAMFVTTEEGLHMAVDAGADIVMPAPFAGKSMSTDVLALITQSKVTLRVEVTPAEDLEWFRRPPLNALNFYGRVESIEASDIDQRALIHAGVPLITSTSAGIFSADQRKLWSESWPPGTLVQLGEPPDRCLRALQQKGMTPMDALATVTRNIARAFKVDKDLGTLERGKFADMVILDKNPLESAQNYRDIHLVMKEGQVIDRGVLPTRRLWTSAPSKEN